MKKSIIYFLLLILIVSIYGCGDSIYGNVDNNGSQASKQDQLDFDFISNNCMPVIAHYDSIDPTGAVLSRDDAFKYLSALLYCGGFNVIGGIDMVNKAGTSDVYGVVGAMLGISEVTTDTLNALSPYYLKAVNICSIRDNLSKLNNTVIDNSTASICGFAGMIGSAVNISSLISSIAGDNISIEISENGFQTALDQIDVNTAVDNFLANMENGNDYLDNLTLSVNTALDSLSSMESILGGSVTMVNDIKDILFDNATNQVSIDTLKAYITSIQQNSDINDGNHGGIDGGSQGNGNGNGHGGK